MASWCRVNHGTRMLETTLRMWRDLGRTNIWRPAKQWVILIHRKPSDYISKSVGISLVWPIQVCIWGSDILSRKRDQIIHFTSWGWSAWAQLIFVALENMQTNWLRDTRSVWKHQKPSEIPICSAEIQDSPAISDKICSLEISFSCKSNYSYGQSQYLKGKSSFKKIYQWPIFAIITEG